MCPRDAIDVFFSFGPFTVLPGQKLLLHGDQPVRLGARALELLLALIEQAGNVVSKEELIARVWPATIVEEGCLRVHLSALRKALGDVGRADHRYIVNVPGRGYCFVAPVDRRNDGAPPPRSAASASRSQVPARLTQTIGRAAAVEALKGEMTRHRLLTITGPAGIGKSTVALDVARDLELAGSACIRWVDLSTVRDHLLLQQIGEALPAEPTLLVLDNCEHAIEAVAAMACVLLRASDGLRILATSRTPLRAEGECVRRLPPLAIPLPSLPNSQLRECPSVMLFEERVRASSTGFALRDGDLPLVAELCRRLEGNPLAIEIAATHVEGLGLHGVADCFDGSFLLSAHGPRGAVPRHQTLRHALGWSYELLSEVERSVLCRLSVLKCTFTLEQAIAVAGSEDISPRQVVDGLVGLVEKSLITSEAAGVFARYRLSDMVRAYATERLSQRHDGTELLRIAELPADWLGPARPAAPAPDSSRARVPTMAS